MSFPAVIRCGGRASRRRTAAWRDAIDKTRAMLTTVVGSNLLDLDDMDQLRAELDQCVARAQAHPESARTELAAIWDHMADRAEFLFQDSRSPTQDRHVRPKILPERPEKGQGQAGSRGPMSRRSLRPSRVMPDSFFAVVFAILFLLRTSPRSREASRQRPKRPRRACAKATNSSMPSASARTLPAESL